MATTPPLIILVDGHSLAFRAYYAFAKGRDGGLKTKSGIPTSVSFGFIKSLLEIITLQKPTAIAVAFDLGKPTFRHEADPTYKSDRAETPEDFIIDIKNLQEVINALNIPIYTAVKYEADDVLGTLSQTCSNLGYQVKIVSGDRDLFQLVDDEKNISVLYLAKNFIKNTDNNSLLEIKTAQVQEILGILPTQVVDYKALCGDNSDCIPGVLGIGEKTAVKLLTEYPNLDAIYSALPQIKGANKTKLEKGKESAYHSQKMARIVTDIQLDFDIEQCQLTGFDQTALQPLLEKLEFKLFLTKINEIQATFGGEVSETEIFIEIAPEIHDEQQLSFFDNQEIKIIAPKPFGNFPINIIDTESKLQTLIEQLETCTNPEFPVSWDTETSSLDPHLAKLVGIGCCWGTNYDQIAYIPLAHKSGNNLDQNLVLTGLSPILASDKYPKVFQNAKYDRLVFRSQGITLQGVVFDTMLAAYVLESESSFNLNALSAKYLGLNLTEYNQIVPKGRTIDEIDITTIAEYCGMQVYATYQLVGKLQEKLTKISPLNDLLQKVELPLEPVLGEMEYTGVRINANYLKELSKQLTDSIKKIETTAYNIAGQTFNIASPKQVGYILFEKLGLDVKKSRKTKSGYSTDVATLEKLQEDHEIIDIILEHRTLSKLKSTYVDALPELILPKTQRVHTNYNQTGTATGRLSSSDPNLQNIPIRTAFSRQIRKAFIPEEGWLMVAADYSQIELRILAHLSQEPILIEAYKNNQDIHTVTAKLLFEKDDITSEERRLGKIINFGVIYGMGAHRFAKESGIKSTEGKKFIERFCHQYPQVFAYLENEKKKAIAHGYVETILGRRRYFNFEGYSLRNPKVKNYQDIDLSQLKIGMYDSQSLRAAANATIQGSSADIIKLAMIKLHELLANYQARLLLQVHDELVFEIPVNEWEELQPKIKEIMENVLQLNVPLIIDIHAGNNWMEAK
jgi:DNA polymerase I